MQSQKSFAWQSFLAILAVIALLLAAVYFLAPGAFPTTNDLLLLGGAGLVAALVLWFIVRVLGNGMANDVWAEATAQAAMSAPVAPPAEPVAPPASVVVERSAESGAVQMLAILQRQGRLIDFLQEDLAPFQDAQIGAAVRSVHAGCKQALDEHVQLEPVYAEAEGSRVTVEPGFDAYAVRLSGKVSGEPPFTGTLQHRGWRAASIELPKQVDAQRDDTIIAAAEVEV